MIGTGHRQLSKGVRRDLSSEGGKETKGMGRRKEVQVEEPAGPKALREEELKMDDKRPV